MEYRKLPHGKEELSTIGLGLGNIHSASDDGIRQTISYAIENGINFFDLCGGRVGVYEAFGDVVANRRNQIYTQMHFGAVYEKDTYGFSRNLELIKKSFDKILNAAKMDYTDMGYIHCIDEEKDFENIMKGGLFDYVLSLKEQGVIKHIGFSTHTPSMAHKFLNTGVIDMFMFSINPAYDYIKGTYAYGSCDDRTFLYKEAERLGAGISVMKPFAGGQLLSKERSPIKVELSRYQCIQYALDRPGVLTCVPGVESVEDVKELLGFYEASKEEREYSILSEAAPSDAKGRCVYCNHCAPCPKGIDIGLVNKYYDLAKVGDKLAISHYKKLSINADNCILCGRCEKYCPFAVKQMSKMQEIKNYMDKI